jgi:hypothetical protein
MSDLHFGETCTELYRFVSSGVSHTFRFNFQPDKVVFNNLTKWAAVAGGEPISVWFRDQTTAGHAYQQQVIDSAAVQSFNFLDAAANGFTVADLPGGQASSHALITGITAADPGVLEHSAFAFQTNQIVRLTDLGQTTPVTNRGMGPLNNNRYRITVIDATHFSLKDPVTGEPVSTIGFPAYVAGGRITLETHVISLNNPQVAPYSNVNPYNPNPYQYDPVTYQLTAGAVVMGVNNDVFNIEVYKFGQVIDLGKI